jgi:two-component system CheB/CheR fusion protein
MAVRKQAKANATAAPRVASAIVAQEIAGPGPEVQEAVAPPIDGFPIVGIGASAGGLGAFEAFFSGMPAATDPGMAFVLIQHLAPDHKSMLPDLIRRSTRMPVFEAKDGMVVMPNCAYVIPPNRDMAFLNGALQLMEPSAPRGQRLPIDFFFRSLAQDQREHAICIVLSGTGHDGTQGVRAIKGEGGMVVVQRPETTEFDGMPRSAIGTGLVDYELAPVDMPAQLIAYAAHAFGRPRRPATDAHPKAENAMKKVFVLLRAQTGHDFSHYKPGTVNRRIERRLAVHQIPTIEDYVKYLQHTPPEAEALFRDLLIGVTRFFRDPEVFKALEEQVIPKIVDGRPASNVIRVWSPACSTGEEAYSIAILLRERLLELKQRCKVQVFATDIDKEAIATARAGLYPASISADISPERLARFFSAESDGSQYRIHKDIREMLLFSEHDVIKDPPFSRLDLISCRNLLIYMDADLQKRLVPLFHYALNPGGTLLLGTSETVGEGGDLFAPLDSTSKLYQRNDDSHGARHAAMGRSFPPATAQAGDVPRSASPPQGNGGHAGNESEKLPLRELTEQALLQQAVSSAALVNTQGDILYLHGRTGLYLEPAPGEAGLNNILTMARQGLRRELKTLLHRASGSNEIVRRQGLRVKTNGDFTRVNLTIRPVMAGPAATPMYLIILEPEPAPSMPDGPASAEAPTVAPAVTPVEGAGQADGLAVSDGPDLDGADRLDGLAASARIASLKHELLAKEAFLQNANNQLETVNQELSSSNEEMQSVNEELQSTNEELETSQEELESVNEELATVNAELQARVTDLSRANNDMNNLLAGTGIGTVFVDHQLRIMRFTPTVTQIINLIPTDVGRPVAHVVSNLVGYDTLTADVQVVLDTLIPTEVEVQTTTGAWYTLRIQPYRTVDNVVEGAVITFVDITEMKQTEKALKKANDMLRLAVVVRDSHDAIVLQDMEGRILAWNQSAERMYGWSESEALEMNIRELIPDGQREEALERVRLLSRNNVLEPYRTQRITKDGTAVDVWLTSTALIEKAGQVYAIATTERPIGSGR